MAQRGSKKARSVEHENKVAREYNGVRSPGSGNSDHDPGDVRSTFTLFECKMTGGLEYDAAKKEAGKELTRSTLLQQFEKVAIEAWSEGREPAVCLRFWAPESSLSGNDGWVDLVVRTMSEDSEREYVVRQIP